MAKTSKDLENDVNMFYLLPEEMLQKILKLLDIPDLLSISLVNGYFYYYLASQPFFMDNLVLNCSHNFSTFLKCFSKSTRKYKHLHLNTVRIDDEFDCLFSVWKKLGLNFNSLSVRKCDIESKFFLELLLTCPELVKLSVIECYSILEIFEKCSIDCKLYFIKLEFLELINVPNLNDAIINSIFNRAPHLNSFSITSCHINFSTMVYARYYSKRDYKVGSNEMKACDQVLCFPYILKLIHERANYFKSLNFSGTDIDVRSILCLLEAKKLNLRELYILRCPQMKINQRILSHLHNLSVLRVDCRCMTALELNRVVLYIGNNLCHLTDLELTWLMSITFSFEPLKNILNLVRLNLSGGIGRYNSEIGSVLCCLKKLSYLDISETDVGNELFFELSNCSSNLLFLNVNSTNVDNNGIEIIITKFQNLRYLNIGNLKLGDNAFDFDFDYNKDFFKNISSLIISQNSITDKVIKNFCCHMPNLIKFDASGCLVTDNSLAILKSVCPKLKMFR